MKNLIIRLSIAVVLVTLVSCEKKYPYPTNDYPHTQADDLGQVDSREISLWGKFLIIDAVMFVDNHETGEYKKYHHFGPNKDISSLRWGGSMFDIETIEKNKTTYSFYKAKGVSPYGKFVLNGDTSKHYGLFVKGFNTTIIEDPVYGKQNPLLGGSARPFSGQILNYDEKTVVMQIQETEGSINGYNCRYWTQLTLKKIEEW
jgi:hypothetical protein